jgi:hypothetical protein
VEAPVGTLCVLDEPAIHACVRPFADDRDQRPSVVVGAVAVIAPRLTETRVLEQTDLVGHRREVR